MRFLRKYMYFATLVPARQPANLRWTFRTHAFTANDRGHVRTITLRLFPAAACEFSRKCKKYFATRPGPRTPTGVRQEMQTVFQQEHAAYNPLLRQSLTAAAEWAKPREIRRGTRKHLQGRRVAEWRARPYLKLRFGVSPHTTRLTGPSEFRFPELENPRRK